MTVSIIPGVLYVVATPIGNLDDISLRALTVLRCVDLIAAEDTRHSLPLLRHFQINKPLLSFHEYNEKSRIPDLLELLSEGKSIALICDAGTPLISDPGFHLLQSLRKRHLKAIPIPGPSSLLAALSVAGLPTDRFVFEGFLPARSAARRSRLAVLAQEERTLVFFEATHRLQSTLQDMVDKFGGDRKAVVARELTKLFEELYGDTLYGICQWIAADEVRQKGEFVILVQGASKLSDEDVMAAQTYQILKALLEELPLKQAVKLGTKITGWKKNELYKLALTINHGNESQTYYDNE
jgi:16S rRNA (cytidine1402-2'-O)-methyltransferase